MTPLETILIVLFTLIDATWQSEYGKHNVRQQNGVGCYKCHSVNGSDAHCGDPFHPAYNMHRYYPKCEQGLDNRVGLFPAKYCTKIKGTNMDTNEEMIVRSCSIAELDNVCGLFEFENARYSGCLMSCGLNACNSGHSFHRDNLTNLRMGTFGEVLLAALIFTSYWQL